MSDDFEDSGVGVAVAPPISKGQAGTVAKRNGSSIVQYRQGLVEDYHKGAPSLVEKLKLAGREDVEGLIVALIDEVIKETDHLLGNELVATEEGNLRDASVISTKRAEVLEKAIKAVQAKQEFERDSGIDIDSPSMVVIIRFMMEKCKEAFGLMHMGDEVSDLFYRTIGEVMENWKKELRERFDGLRT